MFLLSQDARGDKVGMIDHGDYGVQVKIGPA